MAKVRTELAYSSPGRSPQRAPLECGQCGPTAHFEGCTGEGMFMLEKNKWKTVWRNSRDGYIKIKQNNVVI